jgi:hypothetical protein
VTAPAVVLPRATNLVPKKTCTTLIRERRVTFTSIVFGNPYLVAGSAVLVACGVLLARFTRRGGL